MSGNIQDDIGDAIIERVLGFVSQKAKPCVGRSIDYTLLVGLLLLQFLRCSPTINLDEKEINYVCDIDNILVYFSDDDFINTSILVGIGIALAFGVISAIFVWFHAHHCANDLKIHPFTEKMYKCTDRLIFIDSILEIGISFLWAPFVTIVLWSIWVGAAIGLYFLVAEYDKRVNGDVNAVNVFRASAIYVSLCLYKLIGEVSQYWVLYRASTSKDDDPKFERLRQDEEQDVEAQDSDEEKQRKNKKLGKKANKKVQKVKRERL